MVPENGTEENIWMIKSRRMRWAVHITGMEERMTACRSTKKTKMWAGE
jgi:hypothetical protein